MIDHSHDRSDESEERAENRTWDLHWWEEFDWENERIAPWYHAGRETCCRCAGGWRLAGGKITGKTRRTPNWKHREMPKETTFWSSLKRGICKHGEQWEPTKHPLPKCVENKNSFQKHQPPNRSLFSVFNNRKQESYPNITKWLDI